MADMVEISGKKHQISDRNDFYKDGKFTGRFCPRCGPGTKLAEHKGRVTCGKCGYSEKEMKKEAPKQEQPKEAPKEESKPGVKEETKEQPTEEKKEETSEEQKE